jgi:5'-deoxynucleotidase YfbR-like HD superfamily hydrolase
VDSQRCVEIFGDNGAYGSGYALTNSHVITAHHVVSGTDTPRMRLLQNWKAGHRIKQDARILWFDKEQDVALLELVDTTVPWPALAFPDIAAVVDEEAYRFEAQGFPKFRENGNFRDLFAAQGEFRRSAKQRLAHLAIPHNVPREPEEWRGFSGAAVFSSGCLLGVVVSVATAVEGALQATLISELAADQTFTSNFRATSPLSVKTIGVAAASPPNAPRFAGQLQIKEKRDLDELSRFFRLCTRLEQSQSIRSFEFNELLAALPTGGSVAWIRLRGAPGAGKTTLLSALYNFVNSPVLDPRERRVPVYLDAERFRACENPKSAIYEAVAEVSRSTRVGNFVVMVDGLSARDSQLSVMLCAEILSRVSLQSVDAVLWSMSDGFESQFEDLTRDYKGRLPLKALDITADVVGANDPQFGDYLKAFVAVHASIVGEPALPASQLKGFERRVADLADGEDLDQYMLSLVLRSLQWDRYAAVGNIATFLEMYCADRVLGNSFGVSPAADTGAAALRDASSLAYRAVISDFHSKSAPPHLQISEEERRSAAWDLLVEHNNIRDFLVSWFIFDKLRSATTGAQGRDVIQEILGKDLLGYDFPQTINRFVNALIDSRTNRERNRLLKNIAGLLRASKRETLQRPQAQNFLYYLLGRHTDSADASALLEQAEEMVSKLLNDPDDQTRITAKTQARTIAVSQIRLGIKPKGKEFLLMLLKDRELASIDRGYHRLYYRDSFSYRDEAPGCYLDSPEEDWSKTFRKLRTRLLEEFPELASGNSEQAPDERHVLTQDAQHKILTLLLFVQARLERTSGAEKARREFASAVIERALQSDGWPVELTYFLRMLAMDLAKKDAGRWPFILNLYRLKAEPRRGWLARGLHPHFAVGRIESVAEHTYLAILLATFLLPSRIPEIPAFAKEEVVSILAVHDLAEAFTGDIIFRRLQGEQLAAARKAESGAQQYMCWQETYPCVFGTKETWDRLIQPPSSGTHNAKPTTDNGRIAHDIDKLENLIQLYVYEDAFPGWLEPGEFQEFRASLLREMGSYVRKVAMDFVSWASNHQGRLFAERRDFFDPVLVEAQDRVQRLARARRP